MSKGYELREFQRANGLKALVGILLKGVTRKEDPLHLSENSEHDPNGVSIQELYFALTGRSTPPEGVPLGMNQGNLDALFRSEPSGLREDVASTAFAIITGNTLQRKFIDAYDEVPRVGPKLAPDYPSKLKTDTITGFKSLPIPKFDIPEGMNYPDFGTSDKYVTYPEPKKLGGIVRITAETIHFDQTGQIVENVQHLADRLATIGEWIDIGQVFDLFYGTSEVFSTGAYYPSGSVAEMYPSGGTNNNYVSGATTNLSLANGVAAIRAARNQFTSIVDDSGDSFPILHQPNAILAGEEDSDILDVLFNSPGDAGSANLRTNPLKGSRHKYTRHTSAMVDWYRNNTATYTRMGALTWMMGNFQKQYQRKVIFPLATFISSGEDKDDAINKDVIFRFKCRVKALILARDVKHCVWVKGAV